MEKDTFIKRLVQERKTHGYTQKQVAEALGVSNRTYSKWETGENEMDVSTLCRLAEFYHLNPAAFFEAEQSHPLLREELTAMTPPEAAQRCHEWMGELYLGLSGSCRAHRDWQEQISPPPESEFQGTSLSEFPGGALFIRHQGEDANLHLFQMPSREGWGWLRTEAEELAEFFSLLRNPRLLEPLLEFETGGRWNCFTPEYLAEKAGLTPEDAADALDALERRGLCHRAEAKTAAGDCLYTGGETRILRAILTLAHLLTGPGASKGGEEK